MRRFSILALISAGLASLGGLVWWGGRQPGTAIGRQVESARAAPPSPRWLPLPTVVPGQTLRVPLADAPVCGPADAWVTAVWFADFADPESGALFARLQALRNRYPDRFRWALKLLPKARPAAAPDAGDPGARAARLALAAQQKGCFDSAVALLFDPASPLNPTRLDAVERTCGLERVAGATEQLAVERHLLADRKLAARLGVRQTPALFFNGVQVRDLDPAGLESAFATARRLAQDVLASGIDPGQVYESIIQRGKRSVWLPDSPPAGRPWTAGSPSARSTGNSPPVAGIGPGYGPRLGPGNAPVKMIVFVRLGCVFCAQLLKDLRQLHLENPEQLLIDVRPLPDPRKRTHFRDANLALLAARQAPGVWPLMIGLMTRPGAWTRDSLRRWYSEAGLDERQLSSAFLKPEALLRLLQDNQRTAEHLGVNATPYLFINGHRIPGATALDTLRKNVGTRLVDARSD